MAAGVNREHRITGASEALHVVRGVLAGAVRSVQEDDRRPAPAGCVPGREAHAVSRREGDLADAPNAEAADARDLLARHVDDQAGVHHGDDDPLQQDEAHGYRQELHAPAVTAQRNTESEADQHDTGHSHKNADDVAGVRAAENEPRQVQREPH